MTARAAGLKGVTLRAPFQFSSKVLRLHKSLFTLAFLVYLCLSSSFSCCTLPVPALVQTGVTGIVLRAGGRDGKGGAELCRGEITKLR